MQIIKKAIDFVMDILETVTFVGSLFLVIYLFILSPNQIRGASMEPTFTNGDYILTSKVTYKLRPLHRGDIIVFRSPENPDIEFIKRIIGLPGDNITVRDGEVYVNSSRLNEPYISSKTTSIKEQFAPSGTLIVTPNTLFVMGDNRVRSSDSREFGPISTSSIIGYVFYRYYPPGKIGWIKNTWPKNLRSLKSGLQTTKPVFDFLH